LQAEDAFGEPQPNLIQFMEIHQFPADIKLEEGVVIAFEQPDGSQLPGIIREVQGHSVKVDFNHPLAGQEITFDIEILSIDQPPAS
jgi:FKBP-type peptidyl-prolyl cis-trans isomerase SlpA